VDLIGRIARSSYWSEHVVKEGLQPTAVRGKIESLQRRPVVSYMHDTYRVSERRACRVARVPVSTFRYDSRLEPRTVLRLRIREIAQVRVRYGYRKTPSAAESRGLESGKEAGVSAVPRRGPDATALDFCFPIGQGKAAHSLEETSAQWASAGAW